MNKHREHTLKKYQDARRQLRNHPTPQEKKLWYYLKGKNLGYKFQRQHSVGHFIVDFYCFAKKLIIELDGDFHLLNKEYDLERTYYLQNLGYSVLRFWNNEVDSDMGSVLEKIEESLNQNKSS
ncbi:MAG: endonuclease domain-containing protein [bacterium]|nr:endonuclease domain-containing protein [bacterium]